MKLDVTAGFQKGAWPFILESSGNLKSNSPYFSATAEEKQDTASLWYWWAWEWEAVCSKGFLKKLRI